MKNKILCLVAGLVLFHCAHAQKRTNYPKTLLWRISGKDLQKNSYLYGTMHLQDRSLFHFSDSLYAYLQKADGYAMEIDPEEAVGAFMKALSEPDTSGYIYNDMDKGSFNKVAKDLESRFGVPANKITRKQAWLYKMQGSFERNKPDDMPAAMDFYLYNIAKRQGKWVGGIEDIEDQLDLVSELSGKTNVTDLLVSKGESAKQLDRFINIYRSADLNEIAVLCGKGLNSEEQEKLLNRRNQKMALRMDSMAHLRSHFFAVGAAHLPGQQGLIELLQSRGYTVEPVFSSKRIAPEQFTYTEKEISWHKFENEEKTYSVQMPSKAMPYKEPQSGMLMNISADLGTGLFYFVTEVPLAADKSAEEVAEGIAKNMSKNKGASPPQQVTYLGRKATEVSFGEHGKNFRVRLVPNGGEVVMMMAGGEQKDLLQHKEVVRFFQSLELHAAKTAGAPKAWQQHTDDVKAFKVLFPGTPTIKKEAKDKDAPAGAWQVETINLMDVAGNAYYFVVTKETPVGYYIIEDQQLFNETKQVLEERASYTFSRFDTGRLLGYAASWMEGREPTQNMSIKGFNINRGNKAYTAMVIYDSTSSNKVLVDKFLTSFELLPFKAAVWSKQGGGGIPFTTTAPGAFVRINPDPENEMKGYSLSAYDLNSSFSFSVDVEAVAPFYWAVSDSAFFAEKSAEYIGFADSLLYVKDVQRGAAKGKEYLVRMGEGRNLKKLNIFLHGDSTYVVNLIAPEAFIATPEFQPFFSEFRFVNYKPNALVLQSKAAALLKALAASDSATRTEAFNFLDDAPFTKADLPLLHQALLVHYTDGELEYENTSDKLRSRIVSFNDESTVAFIRKNYSMLKGPQEAVQYDLLRTLANIKTSTSYSTIKELLQQAPKKGDPGNLAYLMMDSLQLAHSLFPEVLQLSSDSLFSDVLARLTNRLLDSAMISKDLLVPHHKSLMAQARKKLAALKGKDNNEAWGYTTWVYLLGKFNTAESNALLQQVVQHPSVDLKQEALLALIRNGQTVAPTQLEKVAAQVANRVDLYNQLEKLGKTALFPARFANQKSLAESEMYVYAYDDEPPSSVKFIGERKAMFRGKMQQFYLYRVVYDLEDGKETYLGVTGGYAPGGKKLLTESEAVGFAGELENDKAIDALFKKHLEEKEAALAEEE